MSRNLPRRHSFATDFAEKAHKDDGGKVKKGGGRFRRLRKVSFTSGSKSPNASSDHPDPAARSLSTGDKPLGIPLAGILKQKGNNSPPAVEEDTSPKVIQD